MKQKTIAKIIIYGIVCCILVKLGADFAVYVSDNMAQIRAEQKYAEYKKQKEEESRIRDAIEEDVWRAQQRNKNRYYY